MAHGKVALAEAEQQVGRVVDQLQSIHWQLVGIALSFPESTADRGLEDLDEGAPAAAELRRVVECVLTDRIRLALQDLRSLLPSAEGDEDQL